MAHNGLTHISKILKELELITEELKQHNDRMDKKYGRLDVLPTSDSTTGNARICCGKCKGECE
jgi:hypothetical protein